VAKIALVIAAKPVAKLKLGSHWKLKIEIADKTAAAAAGQTILFMKIFTTFSL
jgi:hypothetical protein